VRASQPRGADRRWGRRFALALLLGLLATAAPAASAQAANYTVGTTEDRAGECAPASGTCSLRQLIEYENARPPIGESESPDAIVVPAGRYDLHLGVLSIKQTLVIVGAGARTTTVDVAAGAEPQRVFEVVPPEVGEKSPTAAITGLTISGGTSPYFGGDIYNTAELVLIEDWITAGSALSGGGISNDAVSGAPSSSAGTLLVRDSLISGNHANSGEATGGGLQNHGAPGSAGARAVMVIEDSTVADNDASLGAGVYSFSPEGTDGNQVTVIDSTIAHNTTREEPCTECAARGPGAGLLIADGEANVLNSILAFNTEETTPSNCSTSGSGKIGSPSPETLGYDLETGTDCNFTAIGDLQATNPDFSSQAPQNNGGPTDTLYLEPNSPAIDRIPAESPFCKGYIDQRGLTRPQGAGCDIGAVEFGNLSPPPQPPPVPVPPPAAPTVIATSPPSVVTTTSAVFTVIVNPHGLPTTVHFEYGAVFGGANTSTITYGSSTPNQTVTPDFANHTVTATVTGLLPNLAYHVRAVAVNGAGNAFGADQLLQTPADPPPPPPVLGKTANVSPVSGVVYIELPPGATLASFSPSAPSLSAFSLSALPSEAYAALTKGRAFIPLTEARQIPFGSTLDTSAGVVHITTATTASSKGKVQFGDFGAGLFKLLQTRKQKGLTELNIIDNHPARQLCATTGKGKKASIAAGGHPSTKVLGRLTANSHGHFTGRGQYSAATVRGTTWGVTNRCDGTLTRVVRGELTVRDFRKRKTITLFTGQTYLARAPRR
jgi:hypothetical protein